MPEAPPSRGRTLDVPLGAPAEQPTEPWGWNRAQRFGVAILTLLLLIFLGIQYIRRPIRLGDPVTDLPPAAASLPVRIDPNTATLPELSRIPHLGEALAGRIIAYRDARKSTAAEGIVFHQPSDLDAVPGIGKKLIDQLAPFLSFPDDATPAP